MAPPSLSGRSHPGRSLVVERAGDDSAAPRPRVSPLAALPGDQAPRDVAFPAQIARPRDALATPKCGETRRLALCPRPSSTNQNSDPCRSFVVCLPRFVGGSAAWPAAVAAISPSANSICRACPGATPPRAAEARSPRRAPARSRAPARCDSRPRPTIASPRPVAPRVAVAPRRSRAAAGHRAGRGSARAHLRAALPHASAPRAAAPRPRAALRSARPP